MAADRVQKPRAFVAAFSRHGKLFVAQSDGTLDLFNAVGSKRFEMAPRESFRGDSGNIAAVAIADEADMVAAIVGDRTVQIWKFGTPEPLAKIKLPGVSAPCLALAADGGRVAAFVAGTLYVWKTPGELVVKLPFAEDPSAMRFAPDGESLIVGTKQGRLHVYGLREGKRPARP